MERGTAGPRRIDAALLVRRLAGPDAVDIALAAGPGGLALGHGGGPSGVYAWRPVAEAQARRALRAALALEALRDAPAADALAVDAGELADALLRGGTTLRRLCLAHLDAAPEPAAALAALRAAVAITATGAASTSAAWLDCGARGTWALRPGAGGAALVAPVSASWPRREVHAALAACAGTPPATL